MRRLLALLALLTLATPAAAQSTRAALTSQNNTNITTNGSGAITGAKLNTVIGAGILSYGTLLDPNTWSSVQTYSVAPIFSTLTGYLYGNGSGALTASTTVPSSSLSGLGTNVATALTQNLNGSGAISASTNPAFVNPSFTNFSTGYTAIPTTGGTTTLTSTSTYVQNTTGTLAQTIRLPNETTVPAGTAYIIDNDSTTAIALQDSAGTVLSSAIPYGMAGYIYSTSNATATGNWAGYAFVPNNVSWGTYTFNYFSQATPANSYFTVDATAASAATGLKMAYVFGAILGELIDEQIEISEVHPIEWQSYLGNRNFTKAQKQEVKSAFPDKSENWIKNKIREMRKQKTIDFVKSIGVNTDNNNVADSAGIAWFAYKHLK